MSNLTPDFNLSITCIHSFQSLHLFCIASHWPSSNSPHSLSSDLNHLLKSVLQSSIDEQINALVRFSIRHFDPEQFWSDAYDADLDNFFRLPDDDPRSRLAYNRDRQNFPMGCGNCTTALVLDLENLKKHPSL